jgi:formate hydrogenlyase subunit 6/NADH:ubiquinone oxidoreductase subunit I
MATEHTMVFDADKCTGCRICELTCSLMLHKEFNPKKSYIRLIANEEANVYIPILDIRCSFCGNCVEACPTKALKIVNLEEAIGAMKGATVGSFALPVYRIAEV